MKMLSFFGRLYLTPHIFPKSSTVPLFHPISHTESNMTTDGGNINFHFHVLIQFGLITGQEYIKKEKYCHFWHQLTIPSKNLCLFCWAHFCGGGVAADRKNKSLRLRMQE